MLKNKTETVAALREIKRISGWSLREIARKSNVNVTVLSLMLKKGSTGRLPTQKTREGIYLALNAAREYAREHE